MTHKHRLDLSGRFTFMDEAKEYSATNQGLDLSERLIKPPLARPSEERIPSPPGVASIEGT
jgi:hypothetical protein